MKILIKLGLFLAFMSLPLFAAKVPAPPESKPDLELNCDEADARIELYRNRISGISANLETLRREIANLEALLSKNTEDYKDCEAEMLRLIGATEDEREAFRQRLGIIEGRVRQMRNLSNDELADRRAEVEQLERDLNGLRSNRLSVIPEYFDKIVSLARDIKSLYRQRNISGYTVGTWAQDRDCLWNISGKMEIYGDPFQWPKIWQANTNIIRNPDIIHPGQVLQIPPAGPKTPDEVRAERKYHRDRSAAAQSPMTGQ